jgi:hypothetical protein
MPAFGPISRNDLIRALRQLGFTGPHHGQGPHPTFMVKGTLLKRLLDQAGIARDECEAV